MQATKRRAQDGSAYLLFVNPQTQKETEKTINTREFVIGRVNTCDITVVNMVISRKHCVIASDDDGNWTVTDTSLTGTYLNRNRLEKNTQHILHNEDVITISGEFSFPFHFFIGDPAVRKKKRRESTCNIPSRADEENLCTPLEISSDLESSSIKNCKKSLDSCENVDENSNKSQPPTQPSAQDQLINSLKEQLEILTKERNDALDQHKKDVETYKLDLQVLDCRHKYSLEMVDNLKCELASMKELVVEKDREVLTVKNSLIELEATRSREDLIRSEVKFREDIMGIVEAELQCSICNEIVIETTVLKCSHMFCSYCIKKWMKKKKECAVCRAAIKEKLNTRAVDSFINNILEKYSPESIEHRKQIIQERKADVSTARSQERRHHRQAPIQWSPRQFVPDVQQIDVVLGALGNRARNQRLRRSHVLNIQHFGHGLPDGVSVIEINDSP